MYCNNFCDNFKLVVTSPLLSFIYTYLYVRSDNPVTMKMTKKNLKTNHNVTKKFHIVN